MPASWRLLRTGTRVLIATCEVCGAEAWFGFGKLWACRVHAAEVEQTWKGEGKK